MSNVSVLDICNANSIKFCQLYCRSQGQNWLVEDDQKRKKLQGWGTCYLCYKNIHYLRTPPLSLSLSVIYVIGSHCSESVRLTRKYLPPVVHSKLLWSIPSKTVDLTVMNYDLKCSINWHGPTNATSSFTLCGLPYLCKHFVRQIVKGQ